MMMPGRAYSNAGAKYKYGFNGQEKSDEVAGEGNSYTAEYWQYDARLGRRWNEDPVKKSWQSDYVCFSNSLIWKVGPDGDDDFFNADGSFSHSTKSGTKIYIQTANGNVVYSQLPMNNLNNRQVLAAVTKYYANQIGITGAVGISNYPKDIDNKALAFTLGDNIYKCQSGRDCSNSII